MSSPALTKFLRSFYHAGQGVLSAWRTQQNFRVHVGAMALVLIVSVLLRITLVEWLFIVLAIGLVLVAELLNSAIEALGDAITREQNPMIGQAKDLAAGAVLLAALTAAVIGALIFGRHLLLWLATSGFAGT